MDGREEKTREKPFSQLARGRRFFLGFCEKIGVSLTLDDLGRLFPLEGVGVDTRVCGGVRGSAVEARWRYG